MTMAARVQEFTRSYRQAANEADIARGMRKGGGGNWFSYSGGHVQLSFGGTNAPMKVTANGLAESARVIASQEEFDSVSREMRDLHNIWLRPYGCGRFLQSGFSLNPPQDCIEPLRLVHGASQYKVGDCVLAVPITEQVQTFRCGDAPGAVNALRWDDDKLERHHQHIRVHGMQSPFDRDEDYPFRCSLVDGAIEMEDNGTRYRVPLG